MTLFRVFLILCCTVLVIPIAHAQPLPATNPLRLSPNPANGEAQLGLAAQATANLQKEFTLEGFFAGQTAGRGTIASKTIGVARTYNIRTRATWDGKVLTLVESYQYSFGQPEERLWRFTKTGPGEYEVEGSEIEGTTELEIKNRVAKMKYKKELPKPDGDGTITLTHRERWEFEENGMLSMQTKLYKFFHVGTEVIHLVRPGNEAALKAPRIANTR